MPIHPIRIVSCFLWLSFLLPVSVNAQLPTLPSPLPPPPPVQPEQPPDTPKIDIFTSRTEPYIIVVTASRDWRDLAGTPAAVRVVSNEKLRTTAALTLDDALRQSLGFQLFRRSGSRTANPTVQGVSLRGVGASGASRALVLQDGIPLNDPFGGWVYWGQIPRTQIDTVEVLLGGASDLYGSAALGGVVNIRTRQAEYSPRISLETSFGNQTTPNVSASAGSRYKNLIGTLSGAFFNTDGYVLVPPSERGRADVAASSKHGLLDAFLKYDSSGKTRFFTRGTYFRESRENGTPLQDNDTLLRRLVAGFDAGTNGAGDFSARVFASKQLFNQSFTAVTADRNREFLTRLQRVPSQGTGLTFQWSRSLGDRNQLVAGLDAAEVRGSSDEIAFADSRPTAFVTGAGRTRTVGVFLQDLISVHYRLFVTLGGRFDHWRNFAAFSSTLPTAPGSPLSLKRFPDRTENAFSPRVSALYFVGGGFSVVASGYRAFRAPTLNELYRSFRVGNVLTNANENLRAERLTGGEAGVHWRRSNNRGMRSVFFWNEITRPIANLTLSDTPTLITRRRENLGRTFSRGVELEAEWQFRKTLSLSGGYQFTDAKVRRFPSEPLLEGLLIPQVPRHQATIQFRYDNPKIASVGMQMRASGIQFDDDRNRLRLNRFLSLDLFVSKRVTDEFEVFFAGENLLNRRNEVGKTPVTTLGPPALLRVGFRVGIPAVTR